MESKDISSKCRPHNNNMEEKHSEELDSKESKNILSNVLNEIFNGANNSISICGEREDGKMVLLLELIAQNLINDTQSEILYLNCSGKFDIVLLEEICMSYISLKEQGTMIPQVLNRLYVVDIRSSKEFHDYLKCLESLTEQITNLSMVVIDDLPFYNFDDFVIKQSVKRSLTRRDYVSEHDNFFWKFSKAYKITIVYSLPKDLIELDYTTDHEEECRIYNKIRKHMNLEPVSVEQMNFLDNKESKSESSDNDKRSRYLFPFELLGSIQCKPDVVILMKKSSEEIYAMHIIKQRDNCERNLSFRVCNRGIIWI